MLDVRDTDSGRCLVKALTGFLIVGAVLAVALAGVLWQLRVMRREDARRARFIREHCWPSALRVPCAPDNEAGVNLADHDECELILSLPDFGLAAAAIDEGLDRLFERLGPPPAYDPVWDAIRDEQNKGEA